MADDRLIPPSVNDATAQAYNEMAARLGDLDTTVLLVYFIDNVPAAVLPALADQFRITPFEWRLALTDTDQRGLIKNAIERRRYKGTPGAIELGLEILNFPGAVEEWFQYAADPFHFQVGVSSTDGRTITLPDFADLLAMIKAYQNKRSRLDVLTVTAVQPGTIHIAAGSSVGITATTQPHP